MYRVPTVAPVPIGAGVACSTACLPRVWESEPVPHLAADFIETEYLVSGVARTYTGPATGPVAVASTGVRYVTRILVRQPRNAADFSGRILVEPFNTSFGADRDALWAQVADLLHTQGDAWIGITTRAMGAAELTRWDPERYREIQFPSNDIGWDVLRDIAALVRADGQSSLLPNAAVRWVYLGGYSQSAVDIATFAMAFGTGTRFAGSSAIYDGYFPAAHAASCAAIASGAEWRPPMEFSRMTDIDVPVIEVQPQTDVEGFSVELGSETFVNPGSASVRRADSDFRRGRYRLYEIAGAPHVARLDDCEGPGSSFPTSAFVRAALSLLFLWSEEGVRPPRAARIGMRRTGPVSESRVDRHGNAVGGVRSPHLDVPLTRYEVHSGPGPLCKLAGRDTPLPRQALIARYQDADRYLSEFTAALDETIRAGHLLPIDREPILRDVSARARKVFATADNQEVLTP